METTSHGITKPQTGDSALVWWNAIRALVQAFNDHTHDGDNSENLTSEAFIATSQTILAASWGSDLGGGKYRQAVTLPGSLEFENIAIQIKTSAGEIVFPTLEKIDATSYYVYTNDNTVALVAYYTS